MRISSSAFALAVLTAGLAGALVSCGGSKAADPEYADPDVAASPANPDGVAYPDDHIGWTPHQGRTRGDRIANLAFQGYVDSNRSGGLKTVSLADYFDPKAVKYKAIHIQIAATWCSICASETNATVAAKDALVAEGAVLLQTVDQGPVYPNGPTLADFTGWMDKHKTNFTVLLDSRAKRLGPLGVTGFPFNALIDPRTMEILDARTGAPDDVPVYVRVALTFVTTKPASY